MKKKYLFIVTNIVIILSSIRHLFDLYEKNQSTRNLLLFFVVSLVIFNLFIFLVFWIMNGLVKRLEKRNKEKYSLYDWLGNPVNPITLINKLSIIKEFTPEDFQGNCRIVKNEILLELNEIEDLTNYKKFLELKNNSPRFTSLLNSSQSIFIAVITATILTFLNLTEISYVKLVISYFFLIISAVALITAIDYMSKAMDRDKILLLLVNECIKEKEKEMSKNYNL